MSNHQSPAGVTTNTIKAGKKRWAEDHRSHLGKLLLCTVRLNLMSLPNPPSGGSDGEVAQATVRVGNLHLVQRGFNDVNCLKQAFTIKLCYENPETAARKLGIAQIGMNVVCPVDVLVREIEKETSFKFTRRMFANGPGESKRAMEAAMRVGKIRPGSFVINAWWTDEDQKGQGHSFNATCQLTKGFGRAYLDYQVLHAGLDQLHLVEKAECLETIQFSKEIMKASRKNPEWTDLCARGRKMEKEGRYNMDKYPVGGHHQEPEIDGQWAHLAANGGEMKSEDIALAPKAHVPNINPWSTNNSGINDFSVAFAAWLNFPGSKAAIDGLKVPKLATKDVLSSEVMDNAMAKLAKRGLDIEKHDFFSNDEYSTAADKMDVAMEAGSIRRAPLIVVALIHAEGVEGGWYQRTYNVTEPEDPNEPLLRVYVSFRESATGTDSGDDIDFASQITTYQVKYATEPKCLAENKKAWEEVAARSSLVKTGGSAFCHDYNVSLDTEIPPW